MSFFSNPSTNPSSNPNSNPNSNTNPNSNYMKPQIRQEGFSPMHVSATTPDSDDREGLRDGNANGVDGVDGDKGFNDLFSMPAHTYMNDSPPPHNLIGRKFPSIMNSGMDFTDELANMIGTAPSGAGLPGHHGSSTHTSNGGVGSYGSSYTGSYSHTSHMGQHYGSQQDHHNHHQHQHHQHGNGTHVGSDETERYSQTHNIFDISAPIPSASLVGAGRPGSVSGHHGHGLPQSHHSQMASSYQSHHSSMGHGMGSNPNDFEAYGSPHLVGGLGNLGLGGTNSSSSNNNTNGNGLGTLGFNSALPALNSSMRYDPHPEPSPTHEQRNGSPNNASPPPASAHPFALQRGTPSPANANANANGSASGAANDTSTGNSNTVSSPSILPAHVNSPAFAHSAPYAPGSYGRQHSRSRSRPPTSSSAIAAASSPAAANGAGGAAGAAAGASSGPGPTRTARTRRTGSVSGTSPPPAFGYHSGRLSVSGAQAGGAGGSGAVNIVIPGSSRNAQGNASGQWFGSSSFSSASEYSLPTPSESHHSLSHSLSHTQQYNPFSLSPTGTESHHPSLPPLHMPGSPYGSNAHTAHSLSMSGKTPLDFSLGAGGHTQTHAHAHSLPKSPAVGMDFAINAFAGSNANGAGGTTATPPGGPPLLPINTSVSARSIGPTSPLAASAVSPVSGTPASAAAGAGTGTGTGTTAGAAAAAAVSAADKQSLLANEKRRRRRESHNAVERRRRDNINEKISELATLIPECMLEGGPTNASTGGTAAAKEGASAGAGGGGAGAGGSGSPTTTPSALETGDPLLPTPSSEKGVKEEGDGEGGVVKANKGMILRKSVEYIRYLQQLVTAQGARNRELELELKQYRGGSSGAPSESGGDMKHGASDKDHDGDDQDQEMMLHDDGMSLDGSGGSGVGGMDFSSLGGYGGMLPSMPEGDNEEESDSTAAHHLNGDMDVDGKERGRTRDVRPNGRHGPGANGALKEEHEDEPQLGFSLSMQA